MEMHPLFAYQLFKYLHLSVTCKCVCSHCINQILESVSHIHQHDIVHRDLKVRHDRITVFLSSLHYPSSPVLSAPSRLASLSSATSMTTMGQMLFLARDDMMSMWRFQPPPPVKAELLTLDRILTSSALLRCTNNKVKTDYHRSLMNLQSHFSHREPAKLHVESCVRRHGG